MEETSVEDRIADVLYGPDEEAEEPEKDEQEVEEVEDSAEEEEKETTEEDKEEPEFIEVEFEGQLYEVPPNLKDALLRTSDYTQKTQEVSAQKRAIEAEQASIKQQRDQYEFINSVQDEVMQVHQIQATIPQWEEYLQQNIRELDAKQIAEVQLNIKNLERQRDNIRQSLQSKQAEFQQAQEQSRKELLDKSTEVLRSKFSDWNGEEVSGYAKSLGFTEDQIAIAQTDPKQMELVRKAMLYDRLQEGKGKAVAKVKAAPQIKPKSRNAMPKQTQDKLNLRKKLKNPNKSDSEKASLIGDDIATRFFS